MSDAAPTIGPGRAAWAPVAVGGLGGALTGVFHAVVVGLPGSMMTLAAFDGAAGVALGAVVMGLMLLAMACIRSRVWATVIGAAAAVAVASLVAQRLTGGFLLLPACLIAGLAALAHGWVAARPRSASPAGSPGADDDGTAALGQGIRILTLIAGGAAALFLSMLSISLLRETLHVGCGYGTQGEALGSWMCADGIGYLLPGLILLFGAGVALLAGLLLVMSDAPAGATRVVLTLLAAVPVLWAACWLGSVTLPRADPLPAGETWAGIWWISVGASTVVALAGIVLVGVARGRAARWLRISGFAALLAALIVQPGLGFAVAAAAALLSATLPLPSAPQHGEAPRQRVGRTG